MANSVDPDKMLYAATSDLGLHCLQRPICPGAYCYYGISIAFEMFTQFWQCLILTTKAPRKSASEIVVCLYHLLNILADFSNLFLHTGKQCGS